MNWPWRTKWQRDVETAIRLMQKSILDIKDDISTLDNTQAALLAKENQIMATTEQIIAEQAAQKVKLDKLIADFVALQNNSNPGPGPGEVIVKQADLDQIEATIAGETAEIDSADPATAPAGA